MIQRPPVYVLEQPIEPKTPADRARLGAALERLTAEDSTFAVETDPESGQMTLKGMSEEQLERVIAALTNDDVSVNAGAPQVAYREWLTKPVTIDYTHKNVTDGRGQFARVRIVFAPLPAGAGFVFRQHIDDGAVPAEFIPSVEKGIRAEKNSGLLAGFPVTDFEADLIDGVCHEIDSNELIFEIAARAAFRAIADKGVVRLAEPIMKVEVVTPDWFLGGVIGDLNARRGMVEGTTGRDDVHIITALVPLSTMFGFKSALHAMCEGRGEFCMQFSHYERVPFSGGGPDNFPAAIAL